MLLALSEKKNNYIDPVNCGPSACPTSSAFLEGLQAYAAIYIAAQGYLLLFTVHSAKSRQKSLTSTPLE